MARKKVSISHWIGRQAVGLAPWIVEPAKLLLKRPWLPFSSAYQFLVGVRKYKRTFRALGDAGAKSPTVLPLSIRFLHPVLYDRHMEAGSVDRHYFHQDLWAARRVFRSGAEEHFDIGSRLDGFVSHCLVFCRVTVIDVRPSSLSISDLRIIQGDATRSLPVESCSIHSLSSLHAMEHFGLGRYGDPIDPAAMTKAAALMQDCLAPAGNLYVSMPIGLERLEFNAQRVLSPDSVVALFAPMELVEFSMIDDAGCFREKCDIAVARTASYACGLFHFRKPKG
ncbi:MAG TPA: DUF268 domain-containing protein [Usitatibacter sp.]|jgi:hypothetical protein|nr:DUF268 domain-containing protein [Usitatibacter sp.]